MENSQKEEMTFFEVLSFIGLTLKKWFLALVNVILKIFRFIYKNILTIFLSIFILLIIGICLYFWGPKKYTTSGTIIVYGTHASTLKEIIDKISFYPEYNKLNKHIKKDSILDNISSISSYYFVDKLKDGIADFIYYPDSKLPNDTNFVIMDDRLFIEMEISEIIDSDDLERKLLSMLNSHPLLIKNYEFHKILLDEEINLCTKEIQRLDSLSNKTYFEDSYNDLQFSGGVIALGRAHTQLFYEDLFKLQDKKSFLMTKKEDIISPVNIPSGITIDPYSSGTLTRYVIIYSIIGFIVGLIAALILRNRKKILEYLNS